MAISTPLSTTFISSIPKTTSFLKPSPSLFTLHVTPPPAANLRRVVSCASTASSASAPVRQPRGIMRPRPVSPEMAELVGLPEISRTEALKRIWAHIKSNKLQDPMNKKIIICDAKLKKIFDGRDQVGFLEVAKLITPHFLKNEV